MSYSEWGHVRKPFADHAIRWGMSVLVSPNPGTAHTGQYKALAKVTTGISVVERTYSSVWYFHCCISKISKSRFNKTIERVSFVSQAGLIVWLLALFTVELALTHQAVWKVNSHCSCPATWNLFVIDLPSSSSSLLAFCIQPFSSSEIHPSAAMQQLG